MNKKTVKQMGISVDKKRRLNKKTVKEIKKVETRRED